MELCLVSRAQRAVAVGHTQAISRLTKHRLVGRVASHQLGHVLLYPICIEWGREKVFRPNPSPFPNCCAFSLNRGRERAFIPFLCLFLICRLFSFFLLAKSV